MVQGGMGMQHLTPPRRRLIPAVSVLVLAASLSACTGADPGATGPSARGERQSYAVGMTECLRSAGWEATARPDDSVYATVAEDQGSAYADALVACEHQLGYDVPPDPLTDEEIRQRYAATLKTVQCLKERGHDPGQPPSEQEYVDHFRVRGGWDPYSNIWIPGLMTEQEYFDLLALCPRAG